MLEFAIVIFIVAVFTLLSVEKALPLFLFLLPFHAFFKSVFEVYGGGGVFSAWKEVVILIFLIKIIKYNSFRINVKFSIFYLQVVFISINTIFLFVFWNFGDSLPTFRDHIFPIFLFWVAASIPFTEEVENRLIRLMTLSIFFTAIFGIVQYFFLRMPIGLLMGNIESVSSSGFVVYSTVSHRIMGLERMSGIIGGPNLFGIFCGLSVVFVLFLIVNSESLKLAKSKVWYLRGVLLLVSTTLLLSFSRAGWGIAVLGGGILLAFIEVRKRMQYYFYFLGVALFVTVAGAIMIPQVADILMDSITGREASMADRDNEVIDGIVKIIEEPWGHGVGSTDNRNATAIFFAESALINIGFEIGLAGVILFVLVHFSVILFLWKQSKNQLFSQMALAVSVPTLFVSLVSINPLSMPYVYYWWAMVGLGINISLMKIKRSKFTNHMS